MKIKNQIISYFVDQSTPPKVFLSPITMNEKVARKIINKEIKNSIAKNKKMLHICYDLLSELIYVTNYNDFTDEQIKDLTMAAKLQITKTYGNYKNIMPIKGSPFSLLRIKKISDFLYVKKSIAEYFDELEDIPVIEANLSRMPKTLSKLPEIFKNNNYIGGLINENVTFIEGIDSQGKKNNNLIRTISAPFILLNISPETNSTHTEKEWAILSGYRDYMEIKNKGKSEFAPLYAIKQFLMLGWPFEEVCETMLTPVNNFISLIKASDMLLSNYTIKNNYYISFKIGNDFPLNLKDKSIPYFDILNYDEKNKQILIKTPIYINPKICYEIFKAKSRPFIAIYNDVVDQIDVKVNNSIYNEISYYTNIPSVIKKYIEIEKNKTDIKYRSNKSSSSISQSSNANFSLRKLTDYKYASDFIKEMCKRREFNFKDIPVLIGPIEKIFGTGIQGGFMGKKQFIKNKIKTPYEIVKGLFVEPPFISINATTMPSYAEQTVTLIHEYSHNIFSQQNPKYEHEYTKLKKSDQKKYWNTYLTDEDEVLAHKEEIKYEIISGISIDEIIRNKIGGALTQSNYKTSYMIALKFKKIVDEVVREIENDQK